MRLAQRITEACALERDIFNKTMGANPHGVGRELFDSANDWRMSAMAITKWESVGRQVLAIHDGLVTALRWSSSSKIVPEVFRALPYLNPMVVFPNPPPLHSQIPGDTYRLLGFIGTGRNSGVTLLDSHDPDATAFMAYCVVEITRADGSSDIEFDYVSIPMVGDPYTMQECVDNVTAAFEWAEKASQESSGRNRFMKDVLTYVIGAVMYLCSTTLEAEKVPRKSVMSHFSKARRPPFSLYRVGWQIGAALSSQRRLVQVKDPSSQDKLGYEQDPQHRRAHFKTVWTGRGSTIPKTMFVAPYWTHLERIGTSGVNTVRKVKV